MLTFATAGLGSPGDTWGISGPHFSALYVAAMVVCAAVMMLLQRILAGQDKGDISLVEELEPEQIALLTRDDAAVATALASLSAANGAVSMTKRPGSSGPDTVAGLRRAVHDAQSSGRARTFAQLIRSDEIKAALEAMRVDLVGRGLVIAPARRALLRMRFLLPLALTLLGLARLVAGWQNHKPITQILLETFIMMVSTVVSVGCCRAEPQATRPARKSLEELRRASPELLPEAMTSQHRSLTTTRIAPMSVALFGTAALVHADPALAETLNIPTVQYAAMPVAGGGGSSGSSCSSSSSCGGGGSSCGG